MIPIIISQTHAAMMPILNVYKGNRFSAGYMVHYMQTVPDGTKILAGWYWG
jgi:hypothetical protein